MSVPGHGRQKSVARSILRGGYTAVVILGLMILFPLLGTGILPSIMVLAVAMAVTRFRRIRQTTLLWILAIATRKGLPLPEELDAYSRTVRGRQRRRLIEFAELLRAGLPLADALDASTGLLPPSTLLAVRVGQETGTLPETLRDLAVRHSRAQQERATGQVTLNGLLVYLGLILTITMSVVSFQMYWIIPKFKRIFEGFGMPLPPITVQLIQIADFVVNYFYLIVPAVLSMFVLFAYGVTAFEMDWERSRWPLRLFPRLEMPSILRNVASLIASRRPLSDGLHSIWRHYGNGRLKRKLSGALLELEQGQNAWEAFCNAGLITAGELSLLNSAERVGNLEWALHLLSDRIERLQRNRLRLVASVLQPLFVFAIGAFVCYYAIAMYYPIVSLIESVQSTSDF